MDFFLKKSRKYLEIPRLIFQCFFEQFFENEGLDLKILFKELRELEFYLRFFWKK